MPVVIINWWSQWNGVKTGVLQFFFGIYLAKYCKGTFNQIGSETVTIIRINHQAPYTYDFRKPRGSWSKLKKYIFENTLAVADKNPLKIHDFYNAEENIPLIN